MNLRTATRAAALLAAAAAAGPGLAGCQPSRDRAVPFDVREAGSTRVEVDPAWRAWALDHYRGELLTELRASSDVRFLEPPTVTASRNLESGAIDLTVIGELDANDINGARLRRPYYVAWRRAGNGWVPRDRQIQPGRPAPLDPRAPAERPRVISPTTAPGTPADPTAAPPPSNTPPESPAPAPAVNPPDPGGTPIPGTGGNPTTPPVGAP